MKPGNWWRAQNGCVDHTKLIKLGDKAFRNWFNLMCLASSSRGVLPEIDDVAIKLRMTPARAAAAIAELVNAKLFDRGEDGKYRPHDWETWQFKNDTKDPTNAQRQKVFRERRATLQGDVSNALRNGQNNTVMDVTTKRPDTETETEDRIVDARESRFTEGSKALASAFLRGLGFSTPLSVPLEFAGTDWRAVGWEKAGWTVDLVETEARRIGPDKPLTYYEKVFATAFAKRQAPLPIVEVKQAEKLTVTNYGTPQAGRSNSSITDALKRELAELERPESSDHQVSDRPVFLISR